MKKQNNLSSYLYKLLSRKDYTSYELKEKIKIKFKVDDEEADKVINQFKELNFVNDENFKYRFIISQALSGFGPYAISHKLKMKGLNVEIGEVEKIALEEDISFYEECKKQALKKLKFLKKIDNHNVLKKNFLNFY